MPTRMREAIGRVEYPPEQVDLVQGMPVEADNGRVLEVRTRILTDPELEAAVARALAQDARTRGEAIRVRAVLGRIELLGQVSSAGVASAADRIAATVPGVPAVRTYLTPAPAQASGSRTRA